MSREWNAGTGADQPARIFMVGLVQKLRRSSAVRELQHLDDAPQAPQPAGVPLLRIDPADTEAMLEVPVEIRLFFWRRLGALGRKAAQRISRCADRAAGPGHGADQEAVPRNARSIRGRRARYSGRHTDARERARFSTRHASRRSFRGFVVEPAGFSRGRADVSVAHAG